MTCSKPNVLGRLLSWVAVCLILALSPVLLPSPAQAGPLDQAKQQGLIGERSDGLLGAVKEPLPTDVAQALASINSERLARYQDIANQNGTSLQAVQAVAGRKLIEKTPSGLWINSGAGWGRKP